MNNQVTWQNIRIMNHNPNNVVFISPFLFFYMCSLLLWLSLQKLIMDINLLTFCILLNILFNSISVLLCSLSSCSPVVLSLCHWLIPLTQPLPVIKISDVFWKRQSKWRGNGLYSPSFLNRSLVTTLSVELITGLVCRELLAPFSTYLSPVICKWWQQPRQTNRKQAVIYSFVYAFTSNHLERQLLGDFPSCFA